LLRKQSEPKKTVK